MARILLALATRVLLIGTRIALLLLARLLTAALLLAGLLTAGLILLAGLVLIRHATSPFCWTP
ncbi:MAG: hypothetical protein BGP05_17825 [Rhizobiales bacterium 62-47]|jgi:hypothetical protein|nr:MAG: hypothetical protein BGP05_17825 [Rhizobiales bacterium 62-47]